MRRAGTRCDPIRNALSQARATSSTYHRHRQYVDNLTHSLTGLMLSRAGLNKVVPHAGWLLLMAANAPDIDVISLIGGPGTFLHYHRWITHAVVMLPVMATLPVLAMRFLFRQK